MTAQGEKEPWYIPTSDPSVINLEHVLPKKPGTQWPQSTSGDAEIYCHRLGNQVLLRASENSGLQNSPFAQKKKVFVDCPYILTSQIAEFVDWTPDSIKSRQQNLADLAVKTWSV